MSLIHASLRSLRLLLRHYWIDCDEPAFAVMHTDWKDARVYDAVSEMLERELHGCSLDDENDRARVARNFTDAIMTGRVFDYFQ